MHTTGPQFLNLFAALALTVPASAQAPADRPQAIFDRAIADFLSGRIAESIAAFDTLAQLQPERAPRLWQRGIALYYGGRYKDCRAQFESHRTVNPNDVENAAWHFACVARGDTPAQARAALLPVGPDSRNPMREIYEMFRGTLSPEQVLAAAGGQLEAEFYAHFYVGLYFEAFRNSARAIEHITAAAADRYAAAGGYMHAVARIHLDILQRKVTARMGPRSPIYRSGPRALSSRSVPRRMALWRVQARRLPRPLRGTTSLPNLPHWPVFQ